MKKKMIITVLVLVNSFFCMAQEIPPAPADKAVVYFARTSGMGFAINFTYFDSAKIIGKANGTNYIRYECEPGNHVFWGRSENRDYVEAELEAGKIYFIEVLPQMGGIKAGVKLNPVDPATDEKSMKKILKLIGKKEAETFTNEKLEKDEEKFQEVIERGLEKYKEEKEKGKKIDRLEKTMFYKS